MDYAMSRQGSFVASRQKFIVGVYAWMAVALLVTAVSAMAVLVVPALQQMIFGNRFSFIILMLGEFALVFYLSAGIRTMSVAAATLSYFGYSVLNGLMLSVIFLVYAKATIVSAFVTAALMFGGMSVFGLVTKKDLSRTAYYLMMAVWGIIIASLVNMFIGSSSFNWMISLVTVVVFTGLTAWDAQKLNRIMVAPDGSDIQVKQSIFGALQLYLDFINIFLALLRIFGSRRD
jgi:FtsH-binding integral membrane protein